LRSETMANSALNLLTICARYGASADFALTQ